MPLNKETEGNSDCEHCWAAGKGNNKPHTTLSTNKMKSASTSTTVQIRPMKDRLHLQNYPDNDSIISAEEKGVVSNGAELKICWLYPLQKGKISSKKRLI